jgi:hypothetical protein
MRPPRRAALAAVIEATTILEEKRTPTASMPVRLTGMDCWRYIVQNVIERNKTG